MAARYEIKALVIDLAAAYPDWKPPNLEATVKQYEDALMGFPIDLLRQAADRCRDTCLFFPKIAEIRKAIGEINTANVPNTSSEYMEKVPISPEIQEYLSNFRRHMEERGMWREARPVKI